MSIARSTLASENGSTYSGITSCAYPGCDGEIIKQKVSDKYCELHRGKHTRRNIIRAAHDVEFIMVDGEGVGEGRDHKYVLLGVGDKQIENPGGFTNVEEIFEFLYEQFKAHPKACFAGYYLGYDFNMWLRLLPRDRAYYLLSNPGRAKRQRVCRCKRGANCGHNRLAPHPVEYRGWQFDILGFKRFRLRPKSCQCRTVTCSCTGQASWMYINDAGPFFQSSLMTALNPDTWTSPVVSPEEYAVIGKGKEARGKAGLDDDMRTYNRLENEVGARLLRELNTGLTSAGIRLNKRQWFGPGQAAQAWMRIDRKLDLTTTAVDRLPKRLKDAIIATYYGGWFEIPCHGIIPGITYEYDLNSAYPTIASRMPCMCGAWARGTGTPPTRIAARWLAGGAPDRLRLVYASVSGRSAFLGPLPYRAADGSVLRPRFTQGWYWQHEIDAARRAGLVADVIVREWYEYEPCNHLPPLRSLTGLYEGRIRVGKDTPQGKAYKLVYNLLCLWEASPISWRSCLRQPRVCVAHHVWLPDNDP